MPVKDLADLLPGERVERCEVHHPLGNSASYAVYPEAEEDIGSLLRYANERGKKVIPVGGGTKRGFGGQEESADILLSLRRLSGIVEHSVGDLTMTVRPGTTMAHIRDELASDRQMVPLDPSWPEYATIGGVIATNDSGPKRLRYGSARDSVIGLRVVYPDGRVIRTGGKVVKNVAGYDMNKLFVGSMGTLGVISEVTLKLRPLAEYESVVFVSFPEGQPDIIRSFVVKLQDAMIEPVALELLNPALAEELTGCRQYTLAIGFEDREKAVHVQEEWVKHHRPSATEFRIMPQQQAKDWWGALSRVAPNGALVEVNTVLGEQSDGDHVHMALKIVSKNIDLIGHLETCDALGAENGIVVKGHAGVGHGIARLYVEGRRENVLAYLEAVRSVVERKKGYVVATHLPLALRRQCRVWGDPPAYFPLLEGIKRTVDPNSVLNYRRFVGGL